MSWTSYLLSSFPCSSGSVNESVGRVILPAQKLSGKQLDKYKFEGLSKDTQCVYTHDDASLETIKLTPLKEERKAENKKYFIVKFNGNFMLCQHMLRQYAKDAYTLNSTVVGFNYRGVGNSKKAPQVFHDLVTDGIAQVQRLLDGGADPEKITLDGVSLGGGVAVMVASYFHQRNQHMYLWADRSFASLSKAAAGIISPNLFAPLDDFAFSSLTWTSWGVMKPAGWEEDIAKAYLSIAEKYKGYMVIAKKSDKTKSTGDGVLDKSSLHYGVKAAEKQRGVRTGVKVLSFTLYGGHNDCREDLVSKENPEVNGQMLFEDFVRRHRHNQ